MPRLLEGNVALQVFGIVTASPAGQNFERNEDGHDQITALAIVQRWPIPTWWSRLARADHQARKLHDFAVRSDGRLQVVASAADPVTPDEMTAAAAMYPLSTPPPPEAAV